MNKLIIKYSDFLVVLLIVLVGFVLRLVNFTEMSLSNDELSAIARLNYSTFSDLIEYGVKTDGHPAGVQMFLYYWTSIFGNSPFAVRLPFILAGTISIFFAYLIAKKWFNSTVGLYSAAAFAFLEYPIFYSQLARPYSFGLLFSLINLYYWSKIFLEKKYNFKYYLFFAFSAALCAYTHYFSLLNTVVLGIFSVFFLNKSNIRFFIVSIIISVLMYIPHIKIFLYQFGVGGVGGWLPKPDNDWILDYLYYVANSSYIVIFSFCTLLIAIIFFFSNKKYINKLQIISILLFLATFLTGFFYSKYGNAVLQNSVMIFSFIFLIMFLFSFIKNENKMLKQILLPVFSLLLISSTVIENKYYSTEHFGEFKKIAQKIDLWNKTVDSNNITNLINVNRDFYIKYYLNDSNIVSFAQTRNDGDSGYYNLLNILRSSNSDYISYSWSNKTNPSEIIEIIKLYYPYIADYSGHFNSEAYLFTKDSSKVNFKIEEPFIKLVESFEFDNRFDSTTSFCGFKSVLIDSLNEYGHTFQYSMNKLTCNLENILLRYKFCSSSIDFQNVIQVISIVSADGNSISWRGLDLNYFTIENNNWNDFVMSYKIPEDYKFNENDILKIYIWNKGYKKLNVDCLELNFYSTLLPRGLD